MADTIEHPEPHDQHHPLPFWVMLVITALAFWGGWYLCKNSAYFTSDSFDREHPVANGAPRVPENNEQLTELGRKLYSQCAVCHQKEGSGLGDTYPPLQNSNWVKGAEFSTERLTKLIAHGLKGEMTVNGKKFNTPMPAYGNALKDYEIAAVITYIRWAWGNNADPVTIDEVRSILKTTESRDRNGNAPMTEAELKAPATK